MNNQIKSALVTGGNGFIGSNLCKHLVSKGIDVNVLILKGTDTSNIQDERIKIFEGDITKPETLTEALKDVSHVFHLAAITSDWGPDVLFEKVNYQGTINVIEASIEAKAQRLIHMSSLSVHQYTGHDLADETTILNGNINAYARTKVKCEKYINGVSSDDIETVIIRPGLMPFGPGDKISFSEMCKALEQGKFAYINGGDAKIGFSYVENLVEGLFLAATHTGAKGETFILADDDILTWRELISKLCDRLGVKAPKMSVNYKLLYFVTSIIEGAWRLLKIKSPPLLTKYRISVPYKDLSFSNKKAKQILGFDPKIKVDAGIGKSINWYLNEYKS